MKTYLHYAFILFLVVAISCGILAYVNTQTAPLIEENKIAIRVRAQKNVFPEAFSFVEVVNENITYLEAHDVNGELLGYIIEATGNGYSGEIKTLVGLYKDMTINKIYVLEQTETPGLGANCTRPQFLALFSNLTKNDMSIDKDGGSIVSITGATITTRTITNSIRKMMENLVESIVPIDINEEGEAEISEMSIGTIDSTDFHNSEEEDTNEMDK